MMTAWTPTQCTAQFAPPNLSAAPSAPAGGLTAPPLANASPTSGAPTGTSLPGGPTIPDAKEAIEKARFSLAEGKTTVALQRYAQAAAQAASRPELAPELQSLKDQFLKSGVTEVQMEAAIRGYQNQIARGFQNQAAVMNAMAAGAAGLSATPGASHPSRDQAAAMAAQAKLALAQGDLTSARKWIDQATALQVPESQFGISPNSPWKVRLEVERAEQLRQTAGGAPAAPVQLANGAPGSPQNVQNGLYQPQADATMVAKASSQQSSAPAEQAASAVEGAQLYKQGVDALAAGEKDQALQLFKQAWKDEARLDPTTRTQLRDKLTFLQARPATAPAAEQVPAVPEGNSEEIQARQRLFREVTGELASAEAMVQDQPLEALDRIQMLRQRVSQSPVEGGYRKQMLAMVDRVLNNVQAYVDQNRSAIDLATRNNQIESEIDQQAANQVRMDSEIHRMVDQFNDLMDKGMYAEAEIVAKKVGELAPDTEVATLMYHNAKIRRRFEEYEAIRAKKEKSFVDAMNDVDRSMVAPTDDQPFVFPDESDWKMLTKIRRDIAENGSTRLSPAEREIRERLNAPVTVSFSERPLQQAVDTLMDMTGIAIVVDPTGLTAEGLTSGQPVTLDLRGKEISLKSALNLMLDPLGLTYVIDNDVLKITSRQTAVRRAYKEVYGVKDLVLPIPNFVSDYNSGLAGAIQAAHMAQGQQLLVQTSARNGLSLGTQAESIASVDPGRQVLGQMNMPMPAGMGGGGLPPMPVNNFGIGGNNPPVMGSAQGNPFNTGGGQLGGAAGADFQSLIQLITSTIESNWEQDGGTDTIQQFQSNLSLVVSAPQETHEAIADLLTALRRLQNLQVTIEVRFITLTDTFFERIGVDFEFQIDDNVSRLPPEDEGPSVSIGLDTGLIPTTDLDIRFTQDSFTSTRPPFGIPDLEAGARFGFAILSDLELFFLLEAAQGNSRTNVLQAPKVTMFDGQIANINDTAQRPFVIGLTPVVGDFAVGQQPVIVVLSDGTNLSVQAVVTPDKRFVRLTLVPMFTRIEDADRTFTFTGTKTTRSGSSVLDPDGKPTGDRDDEEEIVTGSTVQLPTLGTTSVSTTVTVPDGGTILLGGIKRLREGRTERGVPILSKIPYINRLFRNVGIGRETSTLMMTVTPRIIIPEEEEEKVLGSLASP
jgi:general secretion pathway protein D